MIGRDIRVSLTAYEMDLAVGVGVRRQMAAVSSGRQDAHGYNGDGWSIHIHGAGGELAFAKAAGMFWGGTVDTFKDPDVGQIQVRTRSGVGGREDMIIRESDDASQVFVLVVGQIPDYRVVGWNYAWRVKLRSFVRTYGDRPGAFFVPKAYLEPFPIVPAMGPPSLFN